MSNAAPHLSSSTSLLRFEETFEPNASKTIHSIPFQVPEGVEALQIQVQWHPRVCRDKAINRKAVDNAVAEWRPADMDPEAPLPEDIARYADKIPNLVNVILVDPEGQWRGRTDRGRGSQTPLILSADNPPLGFLRGPLLPGTWRAEIELHAVVPPFCTVQLEIQSTSAPDEKTKAPTPAIKEHQDKPGWYRGELHSHSIHSDGAYRVERIVERAKELELDFFTLTDHNTMAGIPELNATTFPTIQGLELTTFYGHHIVVGAKEMIPWHQEGEQVPIGQIIDGFHDQGALFALSHPFSIGDPICTGCRFNRPDLDLNQVDLLEIWHRRWTGERGDNKGALDYWNQLWIDGHRPTAIAVRDWHTKGHEDELPGEWPTTVIAANSTRPADLIAGLRRGAAYVTSGPTVNFQVLLTDGTSLSLGEIGHANGQPIEIEVDIDTLEPVVNPGNVRAELHRNGELFDTLWITEPGRLHWTGIAGDPAWYRIEFWRGDTPLAITNHIELKG